jgi:adenylate cyclase, class 2
MGHETEIKLRIDDKKTLRAKLLKLGARRVFGGTGRVHEWNVLFDTPSQVLKGRRELLRIRVETPEGRRLAGGKAGKGKRILVTFKRPVRFGPRAVAAGRRRHKVREEFELEVSDAATLARIFEGLGMRAWFRYEKVRTTFRLVKSQAWAMGLLIELDETPIGTFVELEGPAKAIDRAAKELGFRKTNYLVTNYFSLYRSDCEQRGQKVSDMLFPKAFQIRKWMTKGL